MDEMKWAWVLFVAATLVMLIRIAMWFFPMPGWRAEKVAAAAEAPAAVASAAVESAAPAAPEPIPEPAPDPGPDWEDEPVPAAAVPAAVPPQAAVPPAPPSAPAGPPPEEFHFRRVRWGMPREEVLAAETLLPLRENERGLVYATTIGDFPCLLFYTFTQDRLVRARLSFSDPSGRDIPPLTVAQAQRRFLQLREQLRERYGESIRNVEYLPRDVSDLRRRAQRQEELAQQYDTEIAEAEARLQRQRGLLENRFRDWDNRAEMVARGLAPLERDLRDLRAWKQEALAAAAESRNGIEQNRAADAARPLGAVMTARWPFARELHDVELKLDFRGAVPRLDIRYAATQALPGWEANEL